MLKDDFEYRATLKFQSLKSYLVDEVIAKIIEQMHPCNNVDNQFISGCYDTSRKIHFRNWRAITLLTTNNSNCGQCYKERNRRDAYLAKRLYRAVVNGRFDLWDNQLDMAEEIPTHQTQKEPTLEQIKYWIKHAFITKADLIKFCGCERIRVVFEDEGVKTDAKTDSHATTTEPEQENSVNSNEGISQPLVVIQPEHELPVNVQLNQELAIDKQLEMTVGKCLSSNKKNKQSVDKSKLADEELKNFDNLPDSGYVDVKVVAALFNCSTPTVWRRVREGLLVAPHHLGIRTTRWQVGEIRQALKRY